jgi:hypothetical protein
MQIGVQNMTICSRSYKPKKKISFIKIEESKSEGKGCKYKKKLNKLFENVRYKFISMNCV